MVSFTSLFLLASAALSAVATPLQVRSFNADLVLLDLKGLDDSIKALDASVGLYPGGLAAVSPIITSFAAVHVTNRKTFDTACKIANLTIHDSYTIIEYIEKTIVGDVALGIKALEAKKAKFHECGASKQIVTALDLLKYDHETLSGALVKKYSQEQDVQLKAYVEIKAIDDSIKGGIAAFS